LAFIALADDLCFIREIHGHAIIEYVERAFPRCIIAKTIAVLNDATIDLVDLVKSAIFHND
jgi:hypothetical protein